MLIKLSSKIVYLNQSDSGGGNNGGGGGGSTTFIGLTDTPGDYGGVDQILKSSGGDVVWSDANTDLTVALSGDVSGDSDSNTVDTVGGKAAADIADTVDQADTNTSDISTLQSTKEQSLGNPSVDGQVLSSTTSGVRSWIDLGAGISTDVTLQGDVTGQSSNTKVESVGGKSANNIASTVDKTATHDTQIADLQATKEDSLGNPSTDGQVLASTSTGDRTWVVMQTVSKLPLGGDLSGTTDNASVDTVGSNTAAEINDAVSLTATNAADIDALESGKEPDLGLPSSDGQVLSSTTAGVRSWVTTGGTTPENYPMAGDVSGNTSNNVVDTVGGKSAADIATSVDQTEANRQDIETIKGPSDLARKENFTAYSPGATANRMYLLSGYMPPSGFPDDIREWKREDLYLNSEMALAGDVSGTAGNNTVDYVGGYSAAQVADDITNRNIFDGKVEISNEPNKAHILLKETGGNNQMALVSDGVENLKFIGRYGNGFLFQTTQPDNTGVTTVLKVSRDRLESSQLHYFTDGIDLDNNFISGLKDPVSADQAATKSYVDQGNSKNLVADNGEIKASAKNFGLEINGYANFNVEVGQPFLKFNHKDGQHPNSLVWTLYNYENANTYQGSWNYSHDFQTTDENNSNNKLCLRVGYDRIISFVNHKFNNGIQCNNKNITNLADPVDDQDAATKAFVLANAGSGGSSSPQSTLVDSNNDTRVQALISGAEIEGSLSCTGVDNSAFFTATSQDDGSAIQKIGVYSGTTKMRFFGNRPVQIQISNTNDAADLTTVMSYQYSKVTSFKNHEFPGGINSRNQRITDVADPVDPQDAATRAWVLANAGNSGSDSASKLENDSDITLVEALADGAALYDVAGNIKLKTTAGATEVNGQLDFRQAQDSGILSYTDTNSDRNLLEWINSNSKLNVNLRYGTPMLYQVYDSADANPLATLELDYGKLTSKQKHFFDNELEIHGKTTSTMDEGQVFYEYIPKNGNHAGEQAFSMIFLNDNQNYRTSSANPHQFQVKNSDNTTTRTCLSIQLTKIDSKVIHWFRAGIDMKDNLIQNLADPVDPQNAVTLKFLNDKFAEAQQSVAGAANPAYFSAIKTGSFWNCTLHIPLAGHSSANSFSFGSLIPAGYAPQDNFNHLVDSGQQNIKATVSSSGQVDIYYWDNAGAQVSRVDTGNAFTTSWIIPA